MALYTSEQMAELYQTGLVKLLAGNITSYSIGDTSFTKQDISKLEAGYKYWLNEMSVEANGGYNVMVAEVGRCDIRGDTTQ